MCKDDKGRLIVSDQYGGLYRLPVPQAGQKLDPSQVEQIAYSPARKPKKGALDKRTEAQKKLPQIGHAQGLCYAFDSLYVVVNGRNSPTGSGFSVFATVMEMINLIK